MQTQKVNEMTNPNEYNGWTNYATWRVNLEVFDGVSLKDLALPPNPSLIEVMAHLRETTEELLSSNCDENITSAFAHAFIAGVNWREIAQHLIDADNED